MREPFFIFEWQPIDVVFANMRNHNIHIAIVLDQFGGTEGLITIEDIIEEIVGEIASESIEPGHLNEEFTQIAENQYRVDGTFRLWELQDALNIELPIDEFETVSGFVID
ncbi:transporter associated domain-containing protein [Amphibacillus indicireducens]